MFFSSNEAPERTDYNAKKTSTLCDVPLLKQSRKPPKNDHFSLNSFHFMIFSSLFLATVHHKELRFLALLSARPGALFELSNTPIGIFSFFWVLMVF